MIINGIMVQHAFGEDVQSLVVTIEASTSSVQTAQYAKLIVKKHVTCIFGFYAPKNSARLFKRGVPRSLYFYKYRKLPKTTVKPYLQKVGHGIKDFDPH